MLGTVTRLLFGRRPVCDLVVYLICSISPYGLLLEMAGPTSVLDWIAGDRGGPQTAFLPGIAIPCLGVTADVVPHSETERQGELSLGSAL